jgi:hypothetical protein
VDHESGRGDGRERPAGALVVGEDLVVLGGGEVTGALDVAPASSRSAASSNGRWPPASIRE